ncbi:isochorismate synthase [Pasteurellaceae bacterium Pebbles2]|nr:isochorismate synthase [Pasteurellaceae bacterium Pebbles2]
MENLCAGLIEQINAHQSPFHSALQHFHASVNLSKKAELLAWLKTQEIYPQFYLNYRDDPKSVVSVGEVRCFFDENLAQHFVNEYNFPLVGGLTFDKKAQFWLPRLLIESEIKNDQQQLSIHLYIDNTQDLAAERQAAINAVKSLEKFTALSTETSQHSMQFAPQKIQLLAQKADQLMWENWVKLALNAIKQGELIKVVLANESEFSAKQTIDAAAFLAESEKQNTGCYHFLFAPTAEWTFVGSTPERLYARQANQLKTEALAGTAAVTDDAAQNQQQQDWLLNDVKNDHENLFVVQDICDNLAPYAKQIDVSDVEIKRLRQVQHLRRRISAELLPAVTDTTCLQAIHPTAAISGLPQQSAVQFLQKTENFDRSWYAGTLGIMAKAQAEFCVTIRSAFIAQNKIRVFAGAGIVAGSVPLLEWQEIERKASGLLSLFSKE